MVSGILWHCVVHCGVNIVVLCSIFFILVVCGVLSSMVLCIIWHCGALWCEQVNKGETVGGVVNSETQGCGLRLFPCGVKRAKKGWISVCVCLCLCVCVDKCLFPGILEGVDI